MKKKKKKKKKKTQTCKENAFFAFFEGDKGNKVHMDCCWPQMEGDEDGGGSREGNKEGEGADQLWARHCERRVAPVLCLWGMMVDACGLLGL